jgi:hypothetical protein
MENFLSALAFAGLIAAQFLSVVLVQTQRCDDQFLGTGIEKRASQRAGHPRNPLGRRPTNSPPSIVRMRPRPRSTA